MAKTLDNLFSSSVKLRQNYDWLLAEKEALHEKCATEKQAALDKFIIKANKQLSSAAYKACDKAEYMRAEMDEKLKKYDVKQYLNHRAVNHKAVKAIFKAIKAGEDYSSHISTMKSENAALISKRAAYAKSLEARFASLKKSESDSKEYDVLKAKLEGEYQALSSSLDQKYSEILLKKESKLDKKLEALSIKIEEGRKKVGNAADLPDDVLLSVK